MNYPRAPWKDEQIAKSADVNIPAGAKQVEIVPWTRAPWTFPYAIDLEAIDTHATDPIDFDLWGSLNPAGTEPTLIKNGTADPTATAPTFAALLLVLPWDPVGGAKAPNLYPWPFLKVTASNPGANDIVARASLGIRNLAGV